MAESGRGEKIASTQGIWGGNVSFKRGKWDKGVDHTYVCASLSQFIEILSPDKPLVLCILVDKHPMGPTLMTRCCFSVLRLAAARPYLHFTTRVFDHSAIFPFLDGEEPQRNIQRWTKVNSAQWGDLDTGL